MRHHAEVEEWVPGGVVARQALPEADRATVDLNRIDFEGLIALGISVGQAARFISQRERRGGIRSVSEVESFYGLAPQVRAILGWSGHV